MNIIKRWKDRKAEESWKSLKSWLLKLIAEHEAECLKELKRQKDEYLKRLKRCRARGPKELEKTEKAEKL